MNEKEIERWLSTIPVLAQLRDSDEERALMELLGGKGLTALLGLLFGTRQALYAALSHQPMIDDNGRWRAAVLQGKIQGIELVVQTVRELAISPTGENK